MHTRKGSDSRNLRKWASRSFLFTLAAVTCTREHSEIRLDRQNGPQTCDIITSPALPRSSLNDTAPKENSLRRLNEGYTLQDMGSMANHYDDGVPWRRWGTLSPRMRPSNGEEPVSGRMWTGCLNDLSQWYIEPITGK